MQLHMQKRWTYTDRGTKLISITGEEKKLSITFTGVMTNTREEIPSITFTGVTTNIRKEVSSITFTGIKTNIQNGNTVNYLYWGNDQHTKENTVNYLYWGNDQHTEEDTVNYLYRGNDQHTKNTGDMRTFDKRKTCKLSVWLMKVCRKSTRFRKRFRQNPLGLAQDLRESTRLGKSFARIYSAFDKRFARIHLAWWNICENPLGFW